MAQLSQEDELRLQVLLTQNIGVIRIDETKMVLHALVDGEEVHIQLHPTERDEYYLKSIRQTLSSHILGSPSGYPVYLKRWTRMGQINKGLKKLLLLGEPEAVSAVIHAPDLNEELARLAWWASPQADNARRMLEKKAIADSLFGQELAQFLIDYIPFETRSIDISNSIRLILRNELADDSTRQYLWRCGEKHIAYRIGFLLGAPDTIPMQCEPHIHHAEITVDNIYAQHLKKLLSPQGQAYLITVVQSIQAATDQDDMIQIFNSLKGYFHNLPENKNTYRHIGEIEKAVQNNLADTNMQAVYALNAFSPPLKELLAPMLSLALVSDSLLDHPFGLSDAIGSVMRRKLKPQTGPVCEWVSHLCSEQSQMTIARSGSVRRHRRLRDRKLFQSR